MSNAIFVCYGSSDECANCGGSASLGGTQDVLVTEWGRFCCDECAMEAHEFQERARLAASVAWCELCGFDNHEHQNGCVAAGAGLHPGDPQ